jgi:alpha-glucosidase
MTHHNSPFIIHNSSPPWWQTGLIYHIYPRSFQDSSGDGVGDLPGITRRLDYLHWLGVDAIWISPVYPSPMADFGYDVSDYTDIHPLFGTLADMDDLIAAAHQRNIRVILDFVPNHTSDQHPWFLESRSARDNPKRDWYIWRDPAPDGGPPNNWISRFDGQSAWEWDEATGQYYLHSFLAAQPDVNWYNPDLRRAMLNVLRFWFERGIDGFRVDVVYRAMKDRQLRDNPPNPDWRPGMDPSKRLIETYTKNTADSHQLNRWLRQVADEYEDKVLIGEMNLPLADLVTHYGAGDEFHLPQNTNIPRTAWTAESIRDLADRYEALLGEGEWPNWVLGNHDVPRAASRAGREQSRVALMLLLTLRGTPINYYGDEIGMSDVEIPPDRVQDPWEVNVPGLGLGRDPERTPMQWSADPNAGFCAPGVTPWLPLADDHEQVNVAAQQARPDSMLMMVRRLIEIRRQSLALQIGSYRSLATPPGLWAYVRLYEEEQRLVVLNFTDRPQQWQPPVVLEQLLLSTAMDGDVGVRSGTAIYLRPNEGQLWALTNKTG